MTPDAATVGALSRLTTEQGVLAVFFALVVVAVGWYLVKILPGELAHRRKMDENMVSAMTMAAKGLDTANLVIQQNTQEFKLSRESHIRVAERMGSLEACFETHDQRAERIGRDTAAIKAVLGAPGE